MNRTMTVAQLSSYLRGVFDDEELLHDVTLTGEVAEVSYSDRHTYLTLADGAYSVKCVHFSSRDDIKKGARVALAGSVAFYDKRNTVSFNYREFFTQGIGDKNARLAELKEKLYKLGYFENRPQLPRYILNVVAITSADGAAIRDLIRVISDKSPFVSVKVYPVKVQGEGSAAQITVAVKALQNSCADAIVLCRGGGSDEDLDTFNDERLATAVALSQKPIISAVGHEIDYTLCDFCAGTRAGTPSIAGEIINTHAANLINDIKELSARASAALAYKYADGVYAVKKAASAVKRAVNERAESERTAIKTIMNNGFFAVKSRAAYANARLYTSANALKSGAFGTVSKAGLRLKRYSDILAALDPHRIIKVGYAAVLRGGRRVKEAIELSAGDGIELIFADGKVNATVTETIPDKRGKL